MMKNTIASSSKRKLQVCLGLFFLMLAVPTVFLIQQAYSQLKWEAFHRHQLMAEELANRIDQDLLEMINVEEARSFTDYTFLNVSGDPKANFIQRSPLSNFPVNATTPSLIGYFQIDTQGQLSTPLLPANGHQASDYGVAVSEIEQRQETEKLVRQILTENSLVRKQDAVQVAADYAIASKVNTPESLDADDGVAALGRSFSDEAGQNVVEEEVLAQAAFDRLDKEGAYQEKALVKKKATRSIGRVEDLKLESVYESDKLILAAPAKKMAKQEQRRKRTEKSALLEQKSVDLKDESIPSEAAEDAPRIRIFESEIDPFSISLLDSGHLVMFRKVWRNGQRYIQGALLDPQRLIQDVVEESFRNTNLSRMSDLLIAYQGNVLSAISGSRRGSYLSSTEELQGALLYQTRLSSPLSDVELIFSINHLPAGPGGMVITWIALILAIVLSGGFLLMYRLGVGQIRLAQQQQDFVSAVSHELKTPLTSIRMYGEMLREGWADEEKKRSYYDYIHDESERLSRLINNVLQLARMTRNELQIDLQSITVNEIVDMIHSKISSHVERAGYTLNLKCDEETGRTEIKVDTDYINQIIINLVDNAIKFSSKSDKTEIDITCQRQQDGSVLFAIRDYGPGIARDQMKKIFTLFYRSENELTRETVGTGIGLSLVQQLTQAMNGKIDVVNREPGAEFRIVFSA